MPILSAMSFLLARGVSSIISRIRFWVLSDAFWVLLWVSLEAIWVLSAVIWVLFWVLSDGFWVVLPSFMPSLGAVLPDRDLKLVCRLFVVEVDADILTHHTLDARTKSTVDHGSGGNGCSSNTCCIHSLSERKDHKKHFALWATDYNPFTFLSRNHQHFALTGYVALIACYRQFSILHRRRQSNTASSALL